MLLFELNLIGIGTLRDYEKCILQFITIEDFEYLGKSEFSVPEGLCQKICVK